MTRDYTFADNFWESPEKNGVTVMMERMRGAKQTCERLKHAYEARALLEEEYGKTLLKIAEKQKPSSMETGSTNQTLLLMQSEFQAIAESHLQLAKLLQEKVTTPLSKLLNKQRSLRKEFQVSINKISNRRKFQIQLVKTAIKRHSVEVAKANALVQQQTSENEKKAIHKMSEPTIKNLQKVYDEAMKGLSDIIDEWNIEWKKTCQNFEKLEQERLEFIKSNISNYANLIVGCLEGEVKACERVNDAAVAIDVDHDLDVFVLEQKSSDIIPNAHDYLKLTSLYESTKRHSSQRHEVSHTDSIRSTEGGEEIKESKHIENLMDKFRNHPDEKDEADTEINVQSNAKVTTLEENDQQEGEGEGMEPVMMVGRMEVYDSYDDDDDDEEEEEEDDDDEGNNEEEEEHEVKDQENNEQHTLFDEQNNDGGQNKGGPMTPEYQTHQQYSKFSGKPKQVSFSKLGGAGDTLFTIEQEEDDEMEEKPIVRSRSPPPVLTTSPKGEEEESDDETEALGHDNNDKKPLSARSFSKPVMVQSVEEVEEEEGGESALAYEELFQEINSKDPARNHPIPDIRPTASVSTPVQDRHYQRRSFGYDRDNMNYHDITRRRLSSIDVNSSVRINNNNNQNRFYHQSGNNQRYQNDTITENSRLKEFSQDSYSSSSTTTSSALSSKHSQSRERTPPSAQNLHDRILGSNNDNNMSEPLEPRQRGRRRSRQFNSDATLFSQPTSSLSSYPSSSSGSSSYGDTFDSQLNKYAPRDYYSKYSATSNEQEQEQEDRGREEEEEEEEEIDYIDYAVAAYDYLTTEEDEITFKQNDFFGIVSKSKTGWWGACLLDRRTNKVIKSGIIPSTYVTSMNN